jgi:hypothetical protein
VIAPLIVGVNISFLSFVEIVPLMSEPFFAVTPDRALWALVSIFPLRMREG